MQLFDFEQVQFIAKIATQINCMKVSIGRWIAN